MTQDEFNNIRMTQDEFNKQVIDDRFELMRAQQRHQMSQHSLTTRPIRQYSMIVAVDLHGAFSKNGEIPWNYPEDFAWFQRRTKGHICVMGRTTYNDINTRLGDKAAVSVLPDRECYVVTSTSLPRNNAVAIKSIAELERLLPAENVSKTVFFCGGERIYAEGIALCNQVVMTVVNKEVDGDKFVPKKYITKFFEHSQTFKAEHTEDIRFIIYRRKQLSA